MKFTEKLVTGGFGMALLLLGSMSAASYLSTQRLLADKRWVVHTYRVIEAIDQTLSSFSTAEVGQQGYAIQGEQTYLKNALTAAQAVKYRLETVQDLTQDNPRQQRRLDQMERLIDQRVAQLQRATAQQRQGPLGRAAIARLSDQGWETKQAVQKTLQVMRLEEQSLLRQRSQAIERSTQRMIAVMGGGLLFSLLLLCAVYLLLKRQLYATHQRSQTALQQEQAAANARLVGILESVTDAFVSLDRDWRYTYVNQRAGQLFNRAPEDLIGKHIWTEFPEGVGQAFYHAYHQAVAAREPIQIEEYYPPWDRWFENRIYPSDEGLSIFFQDITVRKRAELALEQSERRYRSLVLATARVVWTTDAQGQAIEDTATWRALTGQTPAELRGKGWQAAIHPDDLDKTIEAIEAAAPTQSLFDVEHRVRTAQGVYRLFSVRGVPILDQHNQLVEWVGTLTDITEQRQAEQALRQAKADLEIKVQSRTAELQTLNAELRRSNQELEQFAYVVSHDLQEPLRAIVGYTQLLMEDYQTCFDGAAHEYANFIVSGATQMRQLIRDLLDYSRVGTCDLMLTPVDCDAVLQQAIEQLRMAIAESGAVIAAEPLPTVIGDKVQMLQLLQNLIGNAIKFRRDAPPWVHIGAQARCQDTLFWVRDNGIGIQPKYLDRIFDVFKRLHTVREFPGTGIGLAICRKIVDRLGGQIWATSEPGAGTTFYFTVPHRAS